MANKNFKDVTPNKQKNTGLLKRFGIGLLSGVLGGMLVLGGAYALNQQNANSSSSTTTSSSGSTKVSTIKYNVESDTTAAVNKVQKSVVSVLNLQKTQSSSSMFGSQSSSQSSSSSDLQTSSEGSGVIYKKSGDKAYIVTNNHVIDGAQSIEVLLNDGTKVSAKLVGKDTYSDLAVLQISSSKVETVAAFGDSDALKVGEPAIAIGSPLGSTYANSVTQGIISAKNRNISNTSDDGQTININAIQTDAAINPGNSGGPLVNAAGQVIGINSVKIAESSSSSSVSVEGMGFAIPSNEVVSIINQLEANGKVSRPMLGVTMTDLANITSAQQQEILKIPSSVTSGVIIRSVQSASPAEKAGLKQYDVIVAIDDTTITSGTELQTALYKKKVGDSIKITYYRGTTKKTTTVSLTLDQSSLKTSESN